MTVANGEVTREVPVIPGGQRVLGHALEFGRDPLALFQRAREHGDVVRIRFGPFCFYVLNSPSAIRQALVGEARKLGKGLNFGRAKRLIGNGLVMSEGESHHRQRRLMQPAFHRAEIARYVATMREVAMPHISAWPDGGTLALDREMRSITLTVLTRTLLSSDIGADATDEIERLLRVLLSELVARGITANVPGLAWVPTRSNRRFSAANRRLRALLTGIIDGYRRERADHDDLISILMRAHDDDSGTGMTNKQLRDEATTLVIAGSETTGNTIAWACYLLARHPQIQERLQEEADLVLDGTDASYENPEEAALYPRDARLHHDPDRFEPDRWATDYSRSDMRATFFPFGQGIRNCIGEGFAWTESTLLLSAIAARWQLRLADGADVHPVVSSTLVPSELPIIVTRRR